MKQRWRFQVDEYPAKGSKMSGQRTIVESHPQDRDYAVSVPLPNTEIDELVIDGWLHLEAMSDRDYWISIAGLTVNVTLNKDGTPRLVRYELDEPIEGVEYAS